MQGSDILFFSPFVLAFFLIWGYMKKGMAKQKELNKIWREFADLKGLQEQPADHGTILFFLWQKPEPAFSYEMLCNRRNTCADREIKSKKRQR